MKIGLHLLSGLLCTLLCSSLCATEYVFTGTGSFANPDNWENGIMPPVYTKEDDIIRIKGNAIVSEGCDVREGMWDCEENFGGGYGTIIVEKDATLDLRNSTQFQNYGTMVIHGTLINTTTIEGYDTGEITIWGTFINRYFIGNQGIFTVENGGKVENESNAWGAPPNIDLIGTLILKSGGTINFGRSENLKLGANFINHATLTGDVFVPGDLENAGVLSPGNSPGTYTVKGNYIAENTAVHEFEVGGISGGMYDALEVSGSATLAGTLNVTLIDGFTINDEHEIAIIKGGIQGAFASVNIPQGYKLVYRSTEVALQHLTVTPVIFENISASETAGGVKLSWNVAGESDVVAYVVERSTNGVAFKDVGLVPAKGATQYQYHDSRAGSGGYYRIKSVDVDGSVKYSVVVFVLKAELGLAIRLFPLPAQDFVVVQHEKITSNAIIIIAMVDGKVLRMMRPEISTSQTRVDISSLPAGLYLIRLENGGKRYTAKLIKQ